MESNKELHVSYLWVVNFSGVQNSKHYIVTNTQNISGEVQNVVEILKNSLANEESVHPDKVFAHHLHLEGTTIGYTKPISAVRQPCLELDGDKIVPNEAFIRAANRMWNKVGPSPVEAAIKDIKNLPDKPEAPFWPNPNQIADFMVEKPKTLSEEIEDGQMWANIRKRFEHLIPPSVIKKND